MGIGLFFLFTFMLIISNKDLKKLSSSIKDSRSEEKIEDIESIIDDTVPKPPIKVIYYDGLTEEEMISKLNRSLNSDLSGQGHLIVKYSKKYNVSPYLGTAIMLHETGCSWNCSYLAKYCHNYGGMKGSPSCGNSSYYAFNSMEEGIESLFKTIRENYIDKGLDTPEKINTKYAESMTWSSKINAYIDKIRNK